MAHDPGSISATGTPRRPPWRYGILALVAALAAIGLGALLVNIATRKQEQRVPFARIVEVNEVSSDPAPWGANWPREYDGYRRTVDVTETTYGGSSAMPAQKLERDPWLKRMYSGYAFSIDYRTRRGHAYMLYDQTVTERVTERPQPGACLHCHSSAAPTWRRMGLEAQGKPADAKALGEAFDWPAVMLGFEKMSTMPYAQARAELALTPDGTPEPPGVPAPPPPAPDAPLPPPPSPAEVSGTVHARIHPLSCVDCHNPRTMAVRVTRPGFVRGIQALAASDFELPPFDSIARWRKGDRRQPYDPNTEASRQEMRTFVCAQCHVEYYCGPKMVLTYPWGRGLTAGAIERFWDGTRFPGGEPFYDWQHGETGAHVYKVQHPEFEMWSQGTHARAGVACADCHMPYLREGAMKISDHWVRSPLLMVNRSCQVCHAVPEAELRGRVAVIQSRTHELLGRASVALTDMLDAIRAAMAAGASPQQLEPLYALQRSAQWRIDFVSSENSMGFHAPQEAARVLGEAMDLARQAQARAVALRAPAAPTLPVPAEPVRGVTPPGAAPAAPATHEGQRQSTEPPGPRG